MSKNIPVLASSEELGPCHLKIQVTVPGPRVSQEFDHAYQSAARGMKIPGFRPGKAPASMLRTMLGDGVDEHAREHLFEHVVGDALRELEISHRVLRVLELDVEGIEVADGQEVEFAFECEILPDVELPSWDEVEVERANTEPSAEQTEQAMQQLGQSHQRYEDADDATLDQEHLAEGDLIYSREGEEGPKAEGLKMGLGNPLYGADPEAYDAALSGAKAGAEIELDVEFREGFSIEDWVGESGKAIFTVDKIVKPRAAEAAEIAEDLGLESAEALSEKVLERIRWENERQERDRLAFEMLESISQLRPFDLPPRMVEDETESSIKSAIERFQQGGADEEAAAAEAEKQRAEMVEDSKRRLRHWFLLRRIAAAEKLKVSGRDLDEAYRGISAREQVDIKSVREYFKEEGREENLKSNVLEAKVRAHMVGILEERQPVAVASDSGEG